MERLRKAHENRLQEERKLEKSLSKLRKLLGSRGEQIKQTLGDYGAVPYKRTENYVELLRSIDLEPLSTQLFSNVMPGIDSVSSAFESIADWREEKGRDLLSDYIDEFIDGYGRLDTSLTNFSFANQVMNQNLEQLKVEKEELFSRFSEDLNYMGLGKQKEHFDKQAAEHNDAAKRWLWVGGASLVFLVGFSLLILFWRDAMPGPESFSGGEFVYIMVQRIAAKFFVLSVLYYIVIWAGKNYRTHRHNYVINKQKVNALGTFKIFVDSAHSQEIKDSVLNRSTEFIFSASPSGYLSKEPESTTPIQMTELVKISGLGKSGGSSG